MRELELEYDLHTVLAESGRASVRWARHHTTGREVVVKTIFIGEGRGASAAQTFLDACTAVRRLRLPSLPVVREHGVTPRGVAYLIMEPLECSPMMPPATVAALVRTLIPVAKDLEILAHHRAPHLNLRPSNLVTCAGRVRLLGLGTGHLGSLPTPSGNGDDPYVAPELLRPSTDGAPPWRADLYGFGMTMACMLEAILQNDEDEASADPFSGLADPTPVTTLLRACGAEHPDHRPESFLEVYELLLESLGGAVSPSPTSATAIGEDPSLERTTPIEPPQDVILERVSTEDCQDQPPARPSGSAPAHAGEAPAGRADEAGEPPTHDLEAEDIEISPPWTPADEDGGFDPLPLIAGLAVLAAVIVALLVLF